MADPECNPQASSQCCFICMEPCDERCLCKCVDRFAHVECLLKFHKPRLSIACGVCKSPVRNLLLEKRVRRRVNNNTIVMFGGGFIFNILFPTSIYLFLTMPDCRGFLFAISITMFAFSLLALLFLFIGVYRWRYKNEPLLIRRAQERVLPSDGVEMTTAVV